MAKNNDDDQSPNSVPQYQNFTSGIMSNDDNNISQSSPTRGDASNGRDLAKGLESGILNFHAHLKNLEGKYIDLANFYK